MTIGDAIATNTIADQVIALAKSGAGINTALSGAVCELLTHANKALSAGWTPGEFRVKLARASSRPRKAGAFCVSPGSAGEYSGKSGGSRTGKRKVGTGRAPEAEAQPLPRRVLGDRVRAGSGCCGVLGGYGLDERKVSGGFYDLLRVSAAAETRARKRR